MPHGEWTELLKRATVARYQLPRQAEVGGGGGAPVIARTKHALPAPEEKLE